jgi:hypothetical protein
MRSCTTRTLHVSQAIAIPGYAAQVSVRAGSVIAHLVSLNRDGPKRPFIHWRVPPRSFPKMAARIEMQRPEPPWAFYTNMPAQK